MSDLIVTMLDVHTTHLCSKGARAWFKKHNLDYMQFLQHGCPATVLAATNDAFALAVIAQAEKARSEGKR